MVKQKYYLPRYIFDQRLVSTLLSYSSFVRNKSTSWRGTGGPEARGNQALISAAHTYGVFRGFLSLRGLLDFVR